jgi:ParB/RepB/Spo0J family partition protein
MNLKERLDAQARRAVEGVGSVDSSSLIPSRPRALSSPGSALIFQDEVKSLKNELGKVQADIGKPLLLEPSRLVFIPSRKRQLSQEDYDALKANIESSGILEPLRVRSVGDNKFEVTSGSNRGQIGIALGMSALPCVVVEDSDADVERNAFYANLFHAPLPDFEKWQGFSAELSKSAVTQASLAKSSGIPESSLSSLMVFGKLPPVVQEAVSTRRHVVGRVVANAIWDALQRGADASVIVSILSGDAGRISVASFKALNRPAKSDASVAKRVVYKGEKGRAIELVRAPQSIRVVFKSPQDETWLAGVIEDALKSKYGRPS